MQKKIISIHKPPASIRFAPIKHALAVTVEPFKFSPAEPVAYELSYKECIRMLNGLEKTLERKVPDRERRWQLAEELAEYSVNYKAHSLGWPIPSKTETLYETTPKWHGFLMNKLAALAAGGRAEQRTAEYRRVGSLSEA